MHFLQFVLSTFDKLSTRLVNEVFINLELSINLSLYVTSLLFLISFFSNTESVIYFFCVFT